MMLLHFWSLKWINSLHYGVTSGFLFCTQLLCMLCVCYSSSRHWWVRSAAALMSQIVRNLSQPQWLIRLWLSGRVLSEQNHPCLWRYLLSSWMLSPLRWTAGTDFLLSCFCMDVAVQSLSLVVGVAWTHVTASNLLGQSWSFLNKWTLIFF